MRRAAITGIAGQDGTYLARWLLSQGYEVAGLIHAPFDREEPRLLRRFGPAGVAAIRWHAGSLEDPFSLVRFLKATQPDEIYHLAGLTDSRQSFAVPAQAFEAITLGTLRLLEAAREISGSARVFLASSAEIFGAPAYSPQDEQTRCHPVTPYGIAKLAADHFGRLHRERYGQYVSLGILYNHESPLRTGNYLSSRVTRAVAAILRGDQQELVLGDLSAERDWSDARDFVRGFWLALQAPLPADYLFASGQTRRVADLVDTAFRAGGLDYRSFVRGAAAPAPAAPAAPLCGNPRKAETQLNWHREWTVEETVRDMVRAEIEQRPEIERADPVPARDAG